MELAAEAMRGHRSAHSFATGPVIADPAAAQQTLVMCVYSLQMQGGQRSEPASSFNPCCHLCSWTPCHEMPHPDPAAFVLVCNTVALTLHLALRVDNDASIVLEVQEHAVLAAPWLPLADDHCWHDCDRTTGALSPHRIRLRSNPVGVVDTGLAQLCQRQNSACCTLPHRPCLRTRVAMM